VGVVNVDNALEVKGSGAVMEGRKEQTTEHGRRQKLTTSMEYASLSQPRWNTLSRLLLALRYSVCIHKVAFMDSFCQFIPSIISPC
jgi:hypothetical protein